MIDSERQEYLDGVFAMVNRRNFLAKSRPVCPKCSEDFQIQLKEYFNQPALWKCRMCKHKWVFEPAAE